MTEEPKPEPPEFDYESLARSHQIEEDKARPSWPLNLALFFVPLIFGLGAHLFWFLGVLVLIGIPLSSLVAFLPGSPKVRIAAASSGLGCYLGFVLSGHF